MRIIQNRKIWLGFSGALVALSLLVLAVWGLKFGIDFTGGSLLEVGFQEGKLSNDEIQEAVKPLNLGNVSVQSAGENGAILRLKNIDEETHQKILKALNDQLAARQGGANATPESASPVENVTTTAVNPDGTSTTNAPVEIQTSPVGTDKRYVETKSFESIGPVVGNEIKNNTVWAVIITLLAIMLYIIWAFRKVSFPARSLHYAVSAIVALFHDLLITAGVFAVLGHFYGVEVGVTFVAALLTILGYSINDTIVVFDRIRENLQRSRNEDFEDLVNRSVNETFVRSINTSFTVLLTLFALYLFGGSTIHLFVLALLIGVTFGTYSSIFVASALLVTWQKWEVKRKYAKGK